MRAYRSFEIAGRLIQPGRISGQHVHPHIHELLLVRLFSGQAATSAGDPTAAAIHARRQPTPPLRDRCGRPQRGTGGRTTRPAGTTTRRPAVNLNLCHSTTRRGTACRYPLYFGPRSAPSKLSQAPSPQVDKAIGRWIKCMPRFTKRGHSGAHSCNFGHSIRVLVHSSFAVIWGVNGLLATCRARRREVPPLIMSRGPAVAEG